MVIGMHFQEGGIRARRCKYGRYYQYFNLLLMSRYLHGTADITKALFKLADMNGDKKADVFDFVLLR